MLRRSVPPWTWKRRRLCEAAWGSSWRGVGDAQFVALGWKPHCCQFRSALVSSSNVAKCGSSLPRSGSETALPSSRPLRTHHATFTAVRSSLSNALLRTRLHHCQTLAMNLPMAFRVEQHEVAHYILAPVRSPDKMMAMPFAYLGELLVTDWADSSLLFI